MDIIESSQVFSFVLLHILLHRFSGFDFSFGSSKLNILEPHHNEGGRLKGRNPIQLSKTPRLSSFASKQYWVFSRYQKEIEPR